MIEEIENPGRYVKDYQLRWSAPKTIQGVLIKKKPRQTCTCLLTWQAFEKNEYYLLGGYLFFPNVPRNVGSVMSVMNTSTFEDRLTIWPNVEVPSSAVFPVFTDIFPNSWFYWNRTTRNWWANLFSTSCKLLLQATLSIPFSHQCENSLLICELHYEVCWQFKLYSNIGKC